MRKTPKARALLALALAALLCLSGCGLAPGESGSAPSHDTTSAETASHLAFRTEDRLQQHFEKHGQETGCTTAEEYLAAANAVNRADDTVRQAYANMRDGIVVLPAYMPWKNGLYKTDAIFVVYPSQRGGYSAQCVNDHRTKRSKQPFPVAWAGKPEEQLRKISGLGLRFCHPSRFLITADDKATAIEACRRTLRAAGRPVSE